MEEVTPAYRRGYKDGASEMFGALERLLDPAVQEVLRAWIDRDVDGWRLKAMLGHPPTWRLRMLSDSKPGWDTCTER
jgi:hypothetical protein